MNQEARNRLSSGGSKAEEINKHDSSLSHDRFCGNTTPAISSTPDIQRASNALRLQKLNLIVYDVSSKSTQHLPETVQMAYTSCGHTCALIEPTRAV